LPRRQFPQLTTGAVALLTASRVAKEAYATRPIRALVTANKKTGKANDATDNLSDSFTTGVAKKTGRGRRTMQRTIHDRCC
jgi:hypothetical protein